MSWCGNNVGKEVGDLGEEEGEGVDGWFGLVFFIVTEMLQRDGEPKICPPGRQGKMRRFPTLPAVDRAADEFIRAGLVIGEDAVGPKGVIGSGVQDVNAGLIDGALGRVTDANGDWQGE